MTKRIENRIYKNFAMLIFILLTMIVLTLAKKVEAADIPQIHRNKVETQGQIKSDYLTGFKFYLN